MIVKDIATLRTPCVAVLPNEIKDLKLQLELELQKSAAMGQPGIGLAAPQIGIFKKMAICRVLDNHGKLLSVDLVNAKIINAYDPFIFEEGCLSFPGQTAKVKRFHEIHGTTDAYPFEFIAEGLLAVCIQHELDHLEGILLPDNAIKTQRKLVI